MRPLLVTAGATRNPIDAMRFISAFSSGRTGVQIATSLPAPGVTMLGSPEASGRLRASRGVDTSRVTALTFDSTRDLMRRMQDWCQVHPAGIVVHAAAVGDYEAQADAGKISSGLDELVIRLRPAPKILDAIRGWSPDLDIVSFKAAAPETSAVDLAKIAHAQRQRTDSALVFANVIGDIGRDVLLATATGTTRHAVRDDGLRDLVSRLRALRAQ
jgi:phosphopantothenoylcysteine synthetase/decarboxylase